MTQRIIKVCDRCGFEGEDAPISMVGPPGPYWKVMARWTGKQQPMGAERDLCPTCGVELEQWMAAKGYRTPLAGRWEVSPDA